MDFSPIVRALEVAFTGVDGGAETSDTAGERLQRLCLWMPRFQASPLPPAQQLLSTLLSSSYISPTVEISDGRCVAFSPLAVLGVYPSKVDALRSHEQTSPTSDRLFTADMGAARMPALRIAEWALIALGIALHWKPAGAGEAPTDIMVYKERIPTSLPRPRLPVGCVLLGPRASGGLGLSRVNE